MPENSLHLLEQIFGAKSKVAALRVLFDSKVGISGSAVAKRAGMGLLAIQHSLSDLEHLGIVEVERGSVEHRYKVNFKHYLFSHGLRVLYEAERGMVQALADDLSSLLNGHVVSAGLFGSFTRGCSTAGSDIDLLVIVETRKQHEVVSALLSDEMPRFTQKYGLPLQPVIYERRRFRHDTGGVHDLLENAERDWVTVAGTDLKQFRKTLIEPKRSTRRRIS